MLNNQHSINSQNHTHKSDTIYSGFSAVKPLIYSFGVLFVCLSQLREDKNP